MTALVGDIGVGLPPSQGASGSASVASTPDLVTLPTRTAAEAGGSESPVRVPDGIRRLAGIALLLAVWELATRVGWLAPDVLAGPSSVLTAGSDMLRDGSLTEAFWVSLRRVLWGVVVGVPVGAGLALVAGLTRLGDSLVDATVQTLRFVPIIALQPLLIVWLGIGETVKVSLILLGVAFPIYVNTYSAIKAVDPRYLELAATVGLGRTERVRRVVLPSALPGFLVGLRLASAIAWLLLVFAEQINASSGIGYLVIRAQVLYHTDVIVVGLVTYAVLGLLSDVGLRALERRLLRWAPGR